MQIFNYFFRVVRRNVVGLSIYVVIFFILTILLSGNGASQEKEYFTQINLNIAVIDRDQSTVSQALASYLGEIHHCVEIQDDEHTIQDELFFRNVEFVLVIPKGYGGAFLAGEGQGLLTEYVVPGSVTKLYVEQQINRYLAVYSAWCAAGATEEAAVGRSLETMRTKATVTVYPGNEQETRQPIYYFSVYIAYIFIVMMIMAIGLVLAAFRRRDVEFRSRCSAVPYRSQTLQLAGGCAVLGLGIWLLFMVAGGIIYRGEMFTAQGMYFMVNSMAMMVTAMSIGYVVSLAATGSNALNAAANTIGLGMSFCCGVFVPMEYMNREILAFSRFLPVYWYVKNCRLIGGTVVFDQVFQIEYRQSLLIQLGFAAAIFLCGVVVEHRRKS